MTEIKNYILNYNKEIEFTTSRLTPEMSSNLLLKVSLVFVNFRQFHGTPLAIKTSIWLHYFHTHRRIDLEAFPLMTLSCAYDAIYSS